MIALLEGDGIIAVFDNPEVVEASIINTDILRLRWAVLIIIKVDYTRLPYVATDNAAL